uniref:Uncharacterized protein n=1 Tax=Toxoplasma gondii TgCATBr9 TaxID=943120 RepID=A0A2T6IR19_TOXGO|nr:hypothetical protein TGBR9_382790 [Toxoplasma gondii TgCATBr9]
MEFCLSVRPMATSFSRRTGCATANLLCRYRSPAVSPSPRFRPRRRRCRHLIVSPFAKDLPRLSQGASSCVSRRSVPSELPRVPALLQQARQVL